GTPTVVLDVAHNPHAAAALAQNLDSMGYFPQTHAVVGMLNDKDAASVIARLATRVDHWYCAGLEGPRATSGKQMADVVQGVVDELKRTDGEQAHAPSDSHSVVGPDAETSRPGVKPAARPPFNPAVV